MTSQKKSYTVILFICFTLLSPDVSAHLQAGIVSEQDHCLEDVGKLDKADVSKQENESASLKNDRVVESGSKSSAVDVIESIVDEQIYEESGHTTQSERASSVTPIQPLEGGGGSDVYDPTSLGMGEVLESDRKDGEETQTKMSRNIDGSETNYNEAKTNSFKKYLESKSIHLQEIEKTSDSLSSDVRVQGFMKSHIDVILDFSTPSTPVDQLDSKPSETELTIVSVNPPEKLTMEETIGITLKETDYHLKYEEDIDSAAATELLETEVAKPLQQAMDERITPNDYIPTESLTTVSDRRMNNVAENNEDLEFTILNSTDYTSKGSEEISGIISELGKINASDIPLKQHVEKYPLFDNLNVPETNPPQEEDSKRHPVAERYYAFNLVNDDVDHNSKDRDQRILNSETHSGIPQSFKDYEDKSDEDKTMIKHLLNNNPTFAKEKIEPGVLFEDCPDCDLRLLPIRPSEQRITPEFEAETLPSPNIRFPELPEGRDPQIKSLGLSDGIFVFSYLSEFLSWIQPNEFPVELLRDALRSQITWFSLIMQSLRVEAGIVACLVLGVLLALAVPVVVLSHACYRIGGQDVQETGGKCGRCTLVFILELLLILLFAGMVAMFITNEQLSSAVVQSPDVLQTSLSDVSAFVQDSHLQLHSLVTQSIDQTIQTIFADLDNVDSLLGRPIQQDMVRETGIDVALDSLSDLTRETKKTTQQVERFLDDTTQVQDILMASRDKLSDLRQQVELFRRACGPRDRMLCDTIDASGLDVTLQLNKIKADDRLNRMRRMGGVGLELAVADAKEHFASVPSRVNSDTRDSREAVKRQLNRQRADVDEKSREMEQFARDIANKVSEAKYETSFWMQDLDQYEYWRWIVCMGGGAAVLMIWTMLLCSVCCGCCGSEKAAGPTILVTIVLVCLFTTALWTVALVGLLVGGHGEVFLCRPLYDEPEFHVISRLVDQPGVFYSEPRGGFIANVLYSNDSLNVPIKQVLDADGSPIPV